MPNLTPSATRSALVQQLLNQAFRNQGRGSTSLAESLDIAATPIVAALLGKQEELARQGQTEQSQNALIDALQKSQTGSAVGPPTPQQQTRNSLVRALDPEQLSGLAELMISQQFPPETTGERIVHSKFVGDNGNVWFLNSFTGQAKDTGIKASENFVFHEDPAGGVTAVNRSRPADTRTVVPSEEGIDLAANRVSAETQAREEAQDIPTRTELESGIESLSKEIGLISNFKSQLQGGTLQTGPIAGMLPASVAQVGSGGSTADIEDFEAFSGEQVIERIGEATFGALSEGEREFISSTVPGRGTTEEGNIKILERREFAARRARARMNEKAIERGTREVGDLTTGEIEDLIALREGALDFENFGAR